MHIFVESATAENFDKISAVFILHAQQNSDALPLVVLKCSQRKNEGKLNELRNIKEFIAVSANSKTNKSMKEEEDSKYFDRSRYLFVIILTCDLV